MDESRTIITAREAPGGPPAGLGQLAGLRWSHNNPPRDFDIDFSGKTVLVTGANTGLGFEAALKYAALGAAKLILAVRTAAKGDDAGRRIRQRTGRGGDDLAIAVLTVDLGDLASVQAFARALAAETTTSDDGGGPGYLDVALLNAGLANPSHERSAPHPAGWEAAVQANVLSTALMAVLLLPVLRATAAARGRPTHLTFVNSHGYLEVREGWLPAGPGGAGGGRNLLRAADDEAAWDPRRSYAMVKLLGMAVMRAVARATTAAAAARGGDGPEGGEEHAGGGDGRPPARHQQPDVIVNAVCPSLCKTDLGRKFGLLSQVTGYVFQAAFARTAEQGARSLVSATALGPESHARFWHHDVLFPWVFFFPCSELLLSPIAKPFSWLQIH